MFGNRTTSQHARGVISLLALIIMATVTATAVGASVIIINELRQSESIDQSYAAVYAAESGLEHGLYTIATKRHTALLEETKALLDPCYGQSSSCVADDHRLANAAVWKRFVGTETEYVISQLRADEVTKLDYFDPDSATGASHIDLVQINWNDTCDGFSQLETSLLTWEIDQATGTITFDPSSQLVYKRVDLCNLTSGQCGVSFNAIIAANAPLQDLNPEQPYRFTFRPVLPTNNSVAEGCVLQNIRVTAYDETGTIVQIPARINLKATGYFGLSQQALTASIPWKTPVSGLLSFVIFSEEDIVK